MPSAAALAAWLAAILVMRAVRRRKRPRFDQCGGGETLAEPDSVKPSERGSVLDLNPLMEVPPPDLFNK